MEMASRDEVAEPEENPIHVHRHHTTVSLYRDCLQRLERAIAGCRHYAEVQGDIGRDAQLLRATFDGLPDAFIFSYIGVEEMSAEVGSNLLAVVPINVAYGNAATTPCHQSGSFGTDPGSPACNEADGCGFGRLGHDPADCRASVSAG